MVSIQNDKHTSAMEVQRHYQYAYHKASKFFEQKPDHLLDEFIGERVQKLAMSRIAPAEEALHKSRFLNSTCYLFPL